MEFIWRMNYMLLVTDALAGWIQRLTIVKIPSFQELDPLPRLRQGNCIEEELSFPESHYTKLFHSEAKERLRVKPSQKALWARERPTVRTFRAMKYGSCFDTLVIAWMFTLLVAVGFMVHKV